jgi:hypothetical protein
MTVDSTTTHIATRLLQDADTIRALGHQHGTTISYTDALLILRDTVDTMITRAELSMSSLTGAIQ